jgi:hypothetical protein
MFSKKQMAVYFVELVAIIVAILIVFQVEDWQQSPD